MTARIGYADPPYPGCAHLYREHPDFAGEVDSVALLARLQGEYDGWVLHTSVPALRELAQHVPEDARIMAWVKPFAAFRRNVPVAYAWEPGVPYPVATFKATWSARYGRRYPWESAWAWALGVERA